MAEFTAAHPGVELDFTELTYVTHYAAVADGSVDVAFCRLPLGADGLCHGPIVLRDQRMLCVPHDHPFAAAHLLDPELLARERLVRMVPGSVNQEWQDYHFRAIRRAASRSATAPSCAPCARASRRSTRARVC